jgi:hydroxyacylglutathione hydrolase
VETGDALVIDAMRDIQPYLDAAEKHGLRITHVTETHIHADYVSGSRELVAATGAQLYLSDMGDADWKYAFADSDNAILLTDGDSWMVGNVRVDVMHTPGHTPEHIALIITDTKGADKPIGVFTGDFLFVGDIGRPDLLEAAAGMAGTKEPGARRQFATVERFKALSDYLQIWPAHGAGSACGKALGAIPSTTLGYEKMFNPAFQFTDENRFVAWLLSDQPEAPRYFAQMKRVNKLGPALLRDVPAPAQGDRALLDRVLREGALVIDFRAKGEYTAAHLPGTLSIPATEGNFSTYVGWFADYTAPLYAIVPDGQTDDIVTALRAIGVDNLAAVFPASVVTPDAALPTLTADELAARMAQNHLMVLDVRGETEYREVHIAGATHIPLGYLPRHLDELPRDRTIVTQCASGYRSQIAASLLRRAGFTDVVNLRDPKAVWAAKLPTEQGELATA